MRILTFSAYYLPAYRAGGPIKTIANMVDQLGDEFDFRIITKDRDSGISDPFPGIKTGVWQDVGKSKVCYLPPAQLKLAPFRNLMRTTPHDILYLNSFFSPVFTLYPLLLQRLRLVPVVPTVVAPRGEFSPGALGLKSAKKRQYLRLARALGLYSHVIWQASSEREKEEIIHGFGRRKDLADLAQRIRVAPDLVPKPAVPTACLEHPPKEPGVLRVVFLSRITAKKNLHYALDVLRGVRGTVQFDIYGPTMRDEEYWEECQQVIATMPENIRVTYHGAVEPEQVPKVFASHDVFLFPTRGENFGHVILEALSAGCPMLLSDQTPWRGLEKEGVGWDLPLDQPERFTSVLDRLVEMGADEHKLYREQARAYGAMRSQDTSVLDANRHLFQTAMPVVP